MSQASVSDAVATIVAFLGSIGLAVREGTVPADTFLPGIAIQRGELVYDRARMPYPGDLLHEAGHLAIMPPARRRIAHGRIDASQGDEMMAIAWSYAAAVNAGIDIALVFHDDGYRGAARWFRELYGGGTYVALPALQWAGMAYDAENAAANGCAPFPAMRAWLNDGTVYQ